MLRQRIGLSSYQIKIIALILMTLGNLSSYGACRNPHIYCADKLIGLGSIAAPLFLYMLTESLHYTRDRKKFLIRLYVAAICTGLFRTATNFFFGATIGIFRQENILFTYCYVGLYVILIESLIASWKKRNWKWCLLSLLGILASGLPHWLLLICLDLNAHNLFLRDLVESFIRGPFLTEYTLVFVILGILMYFCKHKSAKIIIFSIFCIATQSTTLANWTYKYTCFGSYFASVQIWSLLAVPFMILYNGRRGRENKAFFYLYYPLHSFLISVLSYII